MTHEEAMKVLAELARPVKVGISWKDREALQYVLDMMGRVEKERINELVTDIIKDTVTIVDGGGAFARKITTKEVVNKHSLRIVAYLKGESK